MLPGSGAGLIRIHKLLKGSLILDHDAFDLAGESLTGSQHPQECFVGITGVFILPVPADLVTGTDPQGRLVGVLCHHNIHSEDIHQFTCHCVTPFDGRAIRSLFLCFSGGCSPSVR